MSHDTHAGLMLVLGGVALRLALTDAHLAYVKPAMRPLLALAGVVLIGLAAGVVLRWGGSRRADGDHGHASGAAWLLALPIVAVTLIAPDPLGAFAAGRVPEWETTPPSAPFGPLPTPVDGAVDLSLREFRVRSAYDEERSLTGVAVRLVGFVQESGNDRFTLARFVLSCCAADAAPVRVVVHGATAPPRDTWVEVTGVWWERPLDPEDKRPPDVTARLVRSVPAPVQSYE